MNLTFFFSFTLLYAALNIFAFAVFGCDKLSAKIRTTRIPEDLLIVLAVLGPFGAVTAMVVFRHKTRHLRFLLVPVFVLIHVILFLWIRPCPS